MEVFGGGYAPGCEIVTEVNIQPGYWFWGDIVSYYVYAKTVTYWKDIWSLSSQSECTFNAIHSFRIY